MQYMCVFCYISVGLPGEVGMTGSIGEKVIFSLFCSVIRVGLG